MTSYMYNPSKKVTELLSKFLEFDPEELQLGIWSGDLLLTNVNLRGEYLYSKINRMKKSPSGRDPLKLKILESKISSLRIQIPWKRLVWGQGDVVIDIKGINFVVGFESREETEARQQAEEREDGKTSKPKDENDTDEPVQCSKEFRDAKQKVLIEAEQRLMKGQHLSNWLAQMKKELEAEKEKGDANLKKKQKGFNKWMEKASSNFVWRFLAGLQVNIEGFNLTIVQDNIEVGVIMPNTQIYSGKLGAKRESVKVEDNADDNKSFNKPPTPDEVEEGENIDKAVDALGVSIFVRRHALLHDEKTHHKAVLLPDDYVLRPIDLKCSLSVFYPREEQSRKRKVLVGNAYGSSDQSMGDNSSVASSKRRRGKRDKKPTKPGNSTDGTEETDLVSSFAPEQFGMQRTRNQLMQSDTMLDYERTMNKPLPSLLRKGTTGHIRGNLNNRQTSLMRHQTPGSVASLHRRQTSGSSRSAPLVKPDDLGSVYASCLADSHHVTPKFDLKLNCGELKLLVSSQHLDIMNNFFATGARMRNGRPTATIIEVLGKSDKGNKRNFSGGASVDDPGPVPMGRLRMEGSIAAARHRTDFPSRRMSMGIRNELAAKARSRRTQVVRSWWHYSYGVVAYEIQKRKRRRDNFREKYVSFDWDRQKQRREEYVNLYLKMQLDVGQHVDCDATVEDPNVEELLRIEDDLPIEQILLYRSIARALAIHDMPTMPTSVEVLYKDYAMDLAVEQRASMASNDGGTRINKRLSMGEHLQQLPSEDEDDDNLLSMIGKRCNRGRRYRAYFKQDNVQLFNDEKYKLMNNRQSPTPNEDNEKRSKRRGSGNEGGETWKDTRDDLGASKVSFSQESYTEDLQDVPSKSTTRRKRSDGADGRTIRTFKTTKSARSSAMAGTVFENMTQTDTAARGAKLSFILVFKSVELMLVAGEPPPPATQRASHISQVASSTGSGGSDDVSELSFLSEEDFFREQESAPIAEIEEEETADNPMLSSTDFLLFGLPKNMLLHVILSPVRLKILGRSGGSKNLNFTVGSITASGDGRDNLIAIGGRASPTPVPVVSLTKRDRSSSNDSAFRFSGGSQSGPKEAVTFSLVANKESKVLQADVSKVHINLDIPLLLKLLQFPASSEDGNPRRTLPKSEREEARLFILRENPPSKFIGLNSSIRIHGIELSVPVESTEPAQEEESQTSASSHDGSFEKPENNSPLARVSASIVELYSGTAVEDLCGGSDSGAQVGSLAMLDVAELVTSRGSLSSHHCVVAVSGVNCALKTETDMFAFSNAPSLVAEPIDIEMLFTTNGSTILNEDSPRQEIVVEVSPVHVLLSETRLLFCNRVLQPLKAKGHNQQVRTEDTSMPPRLEALSRLIMRCLDVSIRRLKVSLMSDDQKYPLTPGQKEIIMEESIGDFLSIVSGFDLTFPNEDALSSAMQICIDRLCGLGLYPDDAWDCANSALLSFLEDDAHGQEESDDMDVSMSMEELENSKHKKTVISSVDKAIRNAISDARRDFPPPDDEIDPERQPLNNRLVIDLPGGAQVSTIQLFYDFHMAASLPTLFVTNTAGVRLVRIVPVETNTENTGDQGSSVDDIEGDTNEPGLVFSRFLLDEDHAFGRGGLPLSVLGSDEGAFEDAVVRAREKLDDVHIGEFEFTFSHDTYVDMMQTISTLKSCLSSPESTDDNDASDADKQTAVGTPVISSFFLQGDIMSVLFASDQLAPFCRLRFESLYFKQDGRPSDPAEPHIGVLRIVSRTFSLLNLTEQGQYYPDAISLLYSEDITAFPFQLTFTKSSPPWQVGSKMDLTFRGYRIFLLRNFINEILQYFLSDGHGVGRIRNAGKKEEEAAAEAAVKAGKEIEKDTTPPLAYKIHILDSSLILPRSSKNHDMACIELPKGLIYNSRHQNSFAEPTPTTPFKSERDLDSSEVGKSFFSRMNFQLHQTRIFSSLGEQRSTHGDEESPIFRYFYDVDGRAEPNSWVYTKFAGDLEPPEELVPEFDALMNRRWKEITTDILSLDVLVDYAPSLRVLISEPIERQDFVVAPRLDVRMSQFNMLLSIWYANMQELPVMFPYPPKKFLNDGRNLLWRTVPAEYGTDEYMKVWDDWSCVKTEIVVMLRNLSMRCQFDRFGYFDMQPEIKPFYDDPDDPINGSCVQVYFSDVVVHTYSDLRGMMRVAVGASGFDLIDERRSKHCERTFAVSKKSADPVGGDQFTSFADLTWGLREDSKGLDKSLSQPVQISVFMTKDWSLINLGLEAADGILVELSPIWFFLGFFVSYFQDGAYGHPSYVGNAKAREVKDVLQASRGVELKDPDGLNIDFRLWLSKPHLCIPCDLVDPRAPSLRIESDTGLWYRFKSIKEYKSQEVVSTGLDLLFANEFLAPRERIDSRDSMTRHLVEGLSFALRLDNNNDHHHSDYALQIPYSTNGRSDCSIKTHEIQVSPIILEAPTICTPVESPSRSLGPVVCEITCIVEVLPLTSSVMVNFFSGPVADETIEAIEGYEAPPEDDVPKTISFSGNICDLRLFAVDPVLGVQLPVAVISISSLVLSASQLSTEAITKSEVSRGESPPEDLQVTVDCNLWGDYFKLGVTRSWEPLLEPYSFVLLYEKSKYRGTGISLNADCPLHVNVSGALLLIVDDVIDSFSRLVKEAFGQDVEQEIDSLIPKSSLLRERLIVGEKVRLNATQNFTVLHDIPKPLLEDRVAFSLCNLTGQKMRIHQQEGVLRGDEKIKPAVVTYLNHDDATSLSFDATISVVKNLSVVEVPYPGLPNSQSMRRAKRSTKHAVDVQLPGFRWVQGIKVDTFGRKFESLHPRSADLLSKLVQDWRLENALQLLVEVGLDNGGRLVTVRSLFEVRNNTTHPLSLLLHPDPQHKPDSQNFNLISQESSEVMPERDSVSIVEPGEFFQIPTFLLESSLHMGGSHLGSLWLKPNTTDEIAIPSLVPGIGHEGTGETNFNTVFCSRPVQLAKLVQESAMIYEEYGDSDIAPELCKSGIQISCTSKTEHGEPLAPFCYAIEVGRSPIVSDRRRSSPYALGTPEIHGPVAYTLSVHAPFVVTNLLPETGRFELMHAVRRTVLWYGDLKPGQQVPVHSVGLDAPLLLLLNLGFCRTPVGEGALVHHGADATSGAKDGGLKSLVGKSAGAVGKVVTKSGGAVGKVVTKSTGAVGKVVTKGTGKVGKVVTKRTKQLGQSLAISDFHEKRGSEERQNAEDLGDDLLEAGKALHQSVGGVGSMGLDMGMDTPDGKVHSVETNMYSPQDVAAETEVVDSIGQKLTLSIENVRGGGGQRRIAVYCPFWIVNTTQHSLRYKQEGSKSFVSGTVVDGERDGSKPVDGSTRNYVNRHQLARETRLSPNKYIRSHRPMNDGTIFAGTVGALATSPGRCDLSPSDLTDLIDKDLSLERLADLAFMFNFHEDVLSIGNRRLSVQLADATEHVQYFSDWSRGFSLDSVGFSQIVALHCREGRALELSVVVSVAPGFLSGYTKIVRFVPRYVLVNQLEYPVRLWQDSSVFRPLNEDRSSAGIEELVRGTDVGKWRFATVDDERFSVINQYEALWGRVTLLEESDTEKIMEGTTAHRNASYIASAGPLEFVPFHLPDSRGERQLRVGLGATWNLTASFASDFPGDHTLRVTRAVDLRFVRHVSTRASPQYKVSLPPARFAGARDWDGELGIWFETDWGGDRRIIVKGMKRGRYCFNETDIHAGDELLRIDNIAVSRMSFAETMKLLKQRVAQISTASNKQKMGDQSMIWNRSSAFLRRRINGPEDEGSHTTQDRLVLTFRTLEERLRRLRVKAARNSGLNPVGRGGNNGAPGGGDSVSQIGLGCDGGFIRGVGGLRVEMKPLHHSMFVVLRRQDPENPPFRIENRSMSHTIFYRQRGCEAHPWNQLKPGQTQAYSWEEPMRPKRLAVRAARDGLFLTRTESEPGDDIDSSGRSTTSEGGSREVEHRAARSAKLRQILSYQYVEDEEQGRFGASTIVKLEEIGYRGLLACPSKSPPEDPELHTSKKGSFLSVEVETDGATRILVVSDDTHRDDEVTVMNRRLETLKRQVREEEARLSNVAALRYLLAAGPPGNTNQQSIQMDTATRSNLALFERQVEGLDGDERSRTIEDLAKNMTDDLPEETSIHRKHQVVVEILEAVGLNPENEIGSCNPYCEVVLKGRSKLRKSFFEKRRDKGKTYYARKSLSPKWTDQIFVFDVPQDAVHVTRGHSIHVRVRNFRFVGAHKLLGQAVVHLHSVRDQNELVGWYPLAGRTGSTELENPLSHWGRGSVKLRIHWIHSTPALLDYFIMFTEKRLLQFQERKHGLRDQWRQAADAEKRRKEKDLLRSVVATRDVPKVQKDRISTRKVVASLSKDNDGGEDEAKVSGLQKIAQDRKRLFAKFQKLARKKGRRRDDESSEDQLEFESERWSASHTGLPKITEHASSSVASSSVSGSASSDTSLFDMLGGSLSDDDSAEAKGRRRSSKRQSLTKIGEKSLSTLNFFRPQKTGPRARRGRASEIVGSASGDRSFARATGKLFAQKLFQRMSQSPMNADTSEKLANLMQDSSAISTAEQEETKRLSAKFSNMDTIKELREQGLIFHEVEQYHHRVDPYLFHGTSDNETALELPMIRSWTTAQSFLNDESLNLKIVDDSSFQVVIHDAVKSPPVQIDSGGSNSKRIARKKLSLPPLAPLTMGQRALQHVEYLVESRNQFERACRRALRSVLNPGGWLTIRPITALNLPDTYTGMHVKLKYGPEVVVSSTVDAKVTPTWTPKEVMHRVNTIPDMYDEEEMYEEGNESVPAALNMDRFEFYENDLLFYVEPQKTSGSIRLSVVGERLNNKSELGVLHIPLGAAIGSCIDCIEDYMDSFSESAPATTPMYVRWFPLMNPKDTDPVEGDMGLSSRPPESEKLGDDQFMQYFAPCIQLALMWWPDHQNAGYEIDDEASEPQHDGSQSFHPAQSEIEPEKALTNNYFNADIGRISAALIDSERAKELLSFSALDIDVRYSETDSKTRIGLVIGWVQLDHQEDKSREPVVLAPKPVEHIQPTCQLLVVKDNLRSKKNIMSYEHIRLTLEEMDLTIEESWLFDLWDFFIGVIRRREVRKKANRGFANDMKGDDLLTTESRFLNIEPSDPDAPSLLSLLVGEHSEEDASAGKVYVEQLVLGLLKVNLSYVKGKKQSWELTDKGDWVTKITDPGFQTASQTFSTEDGDPSEMFTSWSQHTYDEDLWAERQGKRSQNLKGIIGAVLPNVSDAPIRLQGKVLDNVFESPSEILSSISKFYVMETLRQVYKIIGSLDFVGNPTMLFSSFVSGVRDLVVTPSVAFLRSPTNPSLVGIGVAKGTLSLFSHSTSGIFGFLAKTTAAAGQAAAVLSLDQEYREWHRERVVIEATNLNREWKKRGVKSVSAMMTKPVGDVFLGVFMGVSGIFTAPYKGYRDGGNLGLSQGVAIAGVGLVVKPIVGLLDAFAHFTASIHDIAKSVNILERRYQPVLKLRLPYTFGLNSVLTPFDSVSSRSVYLLRSFVPKSQRAKSQSVAWKETHVASEVLHMEPAVDTYSIVTTLRVVLVKVKKDSNGHLGPTMCWEVSLTRADKVSSQVSDHGHNGVALTITRRYKPSSGGRFRSLDQRRKLGLSTENHTHQAAAHRNQPPVNKIEEHEENLEDSQNHAGLEDLDPGTPGEAADADDVDMPASSRTAKSQWGGDGEDNPYHSHGATHGDAGETLEWFTVLAEYPNRPQLTRIHNAISCILGKYEAIVQDKPLNHHAVGAERATTFGLFQFEKNWADDAQNGNTERHLMTALERLPWMHESTFEATRGKTHEEQRAILRDIRENWAFSRELEASIKIGGPAWLVEARAHAMFVPSESPLPEPSIPRNDPIIKQILYQQDHGNITREQVRKLFESHLEDLNYSPDDARHGGIWAKPTASEPDELTIDDGFESFAKLHEYKAAFSKVSTTVVHPGSRAFSEFKNQDLDAFQDSYESLPTTLVRPGSGMDLGMSTDFDDIDGYDSESLVSLRTGTSFDSLDRPASAGRLSADEDEATERQGVRSTRTRHTRGNETSLALSHSAGASDERIERMENLMEQLVIFNSQLALMKGQGLADGPSALARQADPRETSVLRHEILALRQQLEHQATKDEATTEILSGLKEELSSIRAGLSVPEKQQSKRSALRRKKSKKEKNKEEEEDDEMKTIIENEKAKHRKKRSSLRWFKGSSTRNKNKKKAEEDRLAQSGLSASSGAPAKDDDDDDESPRSPDPGNEMTTTKAAASSPNA